MSSGKPLDAETIGYEENPYTYNEANGDVDANLWKKAMNVEIESIGSKQWIQSKGSREQSLLVVEIQLWIKTSFSFLKHKIWPSSQIL